MSRKFIVKTIVYLFMVVVLLIILGTWKYFIPPLMPSIREMEIIVDLILSLLAVGIFVRLGKLWLDKVLPAKYARQTKKMFSYSIWIIAFLALFVHFMGGTGVGFGVSLGIFGAGLTWALQRPILCIVGWIIVTSKKLYKEGDRIQIGNNIKGDVADIGIMTTTLIEVGGWSGFDQSTGRILTFPNAWVLEKEVLNYTSGFGWIWDEITVRVPYDSNWEKGKRILEEIGKKFTRENMETSERRMQNLMKRFALRRDFDSIELEPKVFLDLMKSWIEMKLRYICPTGKRRTFRSEISGTILREFKKNRIPITFETVRWAKESVIPA